MENSKLINKINIYLEKNKYRKIEKILLKNKNNEELFIELLNEEILDDYFINGLAEEFFSKLSIDIQKKCIEKIPSLFSQASEELRNDREYIDELSEQIESGKYDHIPGSKMSIYHFLGEKLKNNQEYILSLQDKVPHIVATYIETNDWPIETIKNFFEKNPEYLSHLPSNLKQDINYVCNLIEKLPNMNDNLTLFLSHLDFEYLKNEQIKQAIIKVSSEKTYNLILVCSLAENTERLKDVNPEEFKKLIFLAPSAFYFENRFKNLLTLKKQKDNILLIETINKISKITFSKVDTPQKLTDILYELSIKKGNNLTYEQIKNQINLNWNEILPWIQQIDAEHLLDDGTMDPSENLNVFYKIYNILIGIENNKLEIMFKIFHNSELRSSPYAEGIKNIDVTEENLDFLQFICTSSLFNSSKEDLEMYNKLFLRINKWNNNPYNTLEFINGIALDNNLYQILKNIDIDNIDQDLLLNIYNYVKTGINTEIRISSLDELKNFDIFINSILNKLPENNLETKKNKITLMHFQINIYDAKEILHSYFSNINNNSSLYKDNPEVLFLKQTLESIITATSEQELNEISKKLTSINVKVSFKEIEEIIKKIKISYGNEIQQTLIKAAKNGVIDITDKDFNLIVHVIGAYGATPKGDIYESWNTNEQTSKVSICTSYISDNNMGIAPTGPHSVILGFNELPEDYLELMSCHDLYSTGFSASRQSRFLNPEELRNNTRHGHNELVIRRRKGEFTEAKIKPSYIICFDKINDESKLAAEKFGVPILFVDREKVAERQHNKIKEMIEEFKKTLNPSIIEKIICEQENNRAGLRLIRPDLVSKYFNTEFRQQNIKTIYDIINQELEKDNIQAIPCMKEFVKAIEEEAEKFKITKETPHRRNTYDIEYEELISKIKQNPKFTEEIIIEPELTKEELYLKFLEWRERVNQKEIFELQNINMKNINMEEETKKSR